MDDKITQVDYSSGIIDSDILIQRKQMINSLTDDFQLTFYRTTKQLVTFIFEKVPLLT